MLRLKSEIWVQSYIRRCYSANIPAVVVYRGDRDAGAIYIKVSLLDGRAAVYGPAPAGFDDADVDRKWCLVFGGMRDGGEEPSEDDADAFIARQRNLDQDLWLVEVEDRHGRHLLGDELSVLG